MIFKEKRKNRDLDEKVDLKKKENHTVGGSSQSFRQSEKSSFGNESLHDCQFRQQLPHDWTKKGHDNDFQSRKKKVCQKNPKN